MAKMSRAHFQLIAETIKSLSSTDTTEVCDVVRHSAIVAAFAQALKATNPAFNAERFQDVATGKRAR
jgi:hypothetical protein